MLTCDLCDQQFDPEADDDWFHGMNLGTETTACPACLAKSFRRYVGSVVVEHEWCSWCGHHVDGHDGTGINSGACTVEDCDCVRFEVPVRAEGTDHAPSPTS